MRGRALAEIELSEEADNDLIEIWLYGYAEFGAETADHYGQSFQKAFDLLSRYPFAGEARRDIDPTIRSLGHNSHHIYYDVEGTIIRVRRILHKAVDPSHHLI